MRPRDMAGHAFLPMLQVTEPELPNRLLLCEWCTALKALVKQVLLLRICPHKVATPAAGSATRRQHDLEGLESSRCTGQKTGGERSVTAFQPHRTHSGAARTSPDRSQKKD